MFYQNLRHRTVYECTAGIIAFKPSINGYVLENKTLLEEAVLSSFNILLYTSKVNDNSWFISNYPSIGGLHHRDQLPDAHQCPPPPGPIPLTTSAARAAGGVFRLRPILHLPIDQHHRDAEEVSRPERLARGLPHRADGRVHDARSASRPGSITPTGRP